MSALETPWFLKSKTSDIGRLNQVFEDRLQRSVTEIQMKRRKAVLKIESQIEAIIQEYKTIRSDVDFSTDLDENGNKLDPEACRSKSTGDLPGKTKHRHRRPQSASLVTKPGKKVHAGKKSKKKHGVDMVVENDTSECADKEKDLAKEQQTGTRRSRKQLLKRHTASDTVTMPHLVKKPGTCEANDEVVVNLNGHISELQRVVGKADAALALPNISLPDGVARKKKKKKKKHHS